MPERIRLMSHDSVACDGVQARVWSHASSFGSGVARDQDGAWAAVIGNPTQVGSPRGPGQNIAEGLLEDCKGTSTRLSEALSPPYASAYYGPVSRTLNVKTDHCGLQHLYLRLGAHQDIWLSSSSLALATAFPSTVDTEAIAEWLAFGHFMSQRTFFNEVRKLRPGETLRCDGSGCTSLGCWTPPFSETSDLPTREFIATLLASVSACATGEEAAAELTGGLDSRVVLAALLSIGARTLTWTLGEEDSSELRTVSSLRRRVCFPHLRIALDEFPARAHELVGAMHSASDGEVNALEYAPLLLAFEQLESVRDVSISGSGGEVARGFYYAALRDPRGRLRGISLPMLLMKTTSATAGARSCVNAAAFGDAVPARVAHDLLADYVAGSPAISSSSILDDIYLRGRMQRFAGRNVTTTGLFCRQALPYFSNEFVATALSLPREAKSGGRTMRVALKALDRGLSTVSLDSGDPAEPMTGLAPKARLQRSIVIGRKIGRRVPGVRTVVSTKHPDNVPWTSVREDPEFVEFTHELLLSKQTQSGDYLRRDAVEDTMQRALGGDGLYSLGLLMTLELTLRRSAAGATAP